MPDDQVIQQPDVQQAAGGQCLRGKVEVVWTGCWVSRRMVVNQDDAGRVEPDGVAIQLPDPHQGGRHVALVDGLDAQDVVLGVQDHDAQLLAFQPPHLEDEAVRHVARGADRPTARRPVGEQSTTKLKGGDELRRLGGPDPGHRGEFQITGPGEAGQAVMRSQGVRRKVHRGSATRATPPQQRHEFGRGQSAWPALGEPLSRAFRGRRLADGVAPRQSFRVKHRDDLPPTTAWRIR